MSRLRLTVSYRDRVRRFPFPETSRRLGSSPDSDWVVPFPGVSREHAIVHPHASGVRIVDVGSKNGLVAFGERLEELVLEPGQEVLLGRAALVLEAAESEELDLALKLASRESTESTEIRPGVASDDRYGSPEAALRFIRRIEGRSGTRPQRSDLLREAREVLSCRSLLELGHGEDEEPYVRECLGEVPTDDALRLLGIHLQRIPIGGVHTVLLDTAPATTAMAAVPHAGTALVAVFSGAPSAVESWQDEFLVYVAGRLEPAGGDEATPGSPRAHPSDVDDSSTELPELKPPPGMVLGVSSAMRGLLRHLRVAAGSDLNVLLLGETGTGKELVARMIHASGKHASGPFVAINCAAIPAELLEAELFGIAGRVATGVDARPGLFLQAQGGAIFLDEISETSDRLQAKLLRVLQEREVLPVGGTDARRIDVRVIASSNRNLEQEVLAGRFRDDLYFRLRGLQFHVPPLRERREDVPSLVLHFAQRAAGKYGRRIEGVSRRALELLTNHPWPGNVRELEHEVERAVLLCERCGVLRSEHFSAISRRRERPEPRWETARSPDERASPEGAARREEPGETNLQQQVEEVERQAILRALATSGGNKTRAAELLGITRNGLSLKMKRLGVESGGGRSTSAGSQLR